MSDNTTPLKICTKCSNEYPATPEFWYSNPNYKYGLCSICKPCKRDYSRAWKRANPEKRAAARRRYYERYPEKRREADRRQREARSDFYRRTVTKAVDGQRYNAGAVLSMYKEMSTQKKEKLWAIGGIEGWVYFVASGGMVKIGFTNDVTARLRTLRRACALPCELLIAIAGSRRFEIYLHSLFDDYRHHGEWFMFAEDILDFIDFLSVHSVIEGVIE